MASSLASRARAQKAGADRAAKDKRQKIVAVVGVVILVLLLALELPKTLARLKGSSSSSGSTVTSPVVAVPSEPVAPRVSKAYTQALKQAPRDVFVQKHVNGPSTLGSLATPAGLHDPFAKPHSAGAAVAPAAPKAVAASPLPGTIVIGTPGAGKIAVQGWIVILASIPTAQGQASASAFAARAGTSNIGKVSILNSSNRRPLRGGYWVVYTGPFNTLAEVSAAASHVHSSGFTTAYIRQLVVYKAKPKSATKPAKPKSKKK